MPRRKIAWALLTLTGALVACGFGAPQEKTQVAPKKAPRASLDGQLGRGPMARVPSGTFGPHLVMSEAGPFVAWGEPAAGGVEWRTMAPGTKHRLRLGPTLPRTPGTLSFFELERAKGGAILARVTRKERVETVSITLLTPNGAGPPRDLSAAEGEVLWVASAVEPQITRVVWARRRGAFAEISSTRLDLAGLPGPNEVLRRESIGWQLGQGGAGSWLASLEGSSRQAALTLTRLDTPASERRTIELTKALAGADQVDVAVGDQGVTVTVREVTSVGTRLLMAEVDAAGKVTVPLRPISGPRGAQSLLELLPGAGNGRPWLAWEEAALDGPSWRRVLLARLQPDGIGAPDAWLDVHDASSLFPSLATAGPSLVALTRETPCAQDDCQGTPSGLSLLALGTASGGKGTIGRLSGLPDELDHAALCWDLDCLGSDCALLCAESDTPTSIHFVSIDPAEAAGAAGPALHALAGVPRMARREVVASVPELSDLAIGQSDDRTVLSWVSYFDPALRVGPLKGPAPDGRREPFQAELRTLCLERSVGSPGALTTAPARILEDLTISRRARSLGGVALSGVRAGRRVLGWAALDQGSAHVFVTLLDAQGKKLKQRLLSRKSGEVTDVQVAATGAGFLVAWVDDRSGRGQVYAQAVDAELNPVGPERTLTSEATAPVGLALLQRKDEVILAFADGAGGRSGSIFVTSVQATSLQTTVPPRVLAHGDTHVHSPLLFVGPSGDLGLAFIENRSTDDEATATELLAATLDDGLRVVGAPVRLIPGVDVSSFALDCDPKSCRLVAISAGDRRAEVWAATSVGSGAWRSEFLQSVDGDAQRLPPPVLVGSEAYVVAPDGPEQGFAIERLLIDFGAAAAAR